MNTKTIRESMHRHPLLYALALTGMAWASPLPAVLAGLAMAAFYAWPSLERRAPELKAAAAVATTGSDTLQIIQTVGAVMRDERLIQQRRDAEAMQASMWGMRAEKAMLEPNEAEARRCLERKQVHDALRDRLDEELKAQHAAVEGMRPHAEAAWRESVEARAGEGLLAIRTRRAEAKREIVLTVSGLRTPEGKQSFARTAEAVAAKEAEADALADLLGDATAPDEHAAEWDRIERDERVTAELDQLRDRIKPKGGVLKASAPEAQSERARGGK